MLLWKIAAINIMCTSLGILISRASVNLSHGFGFYMSVQRLSKFLIVCLTVSYATSRVFVVAEAFFSLRYVPIGVYLSIPWTQCIAHI